MADENEIKVEYDSDGDDAVFDDDGECFGDGALYEADVDSNETYSGHGNNLSIVEDSDEEK